MKPSPAALRIQHDDACRDMTFLVGVRKVMAEHRFTLKSATRAAGTEIARVALDEAADHIDDHVLSVLDTAIEDLEYEYGIRRDCYTDAPEAAE